MQRQWKNTRSQLNRKARKNFMKKIESGEARMPPPPKGSVSQHCTLTHPDLRGNREYPLHAHYVLYTMPTPYII